MASVVDKAPFKVLTGDGSRSRTISHLLVNGRSAALIDVGDDWWTLLDVLDLNVDRA